MPMRGELREPFSVQNSACETFLRGCSRCQIWRFLIGLKNVSPQYDEIVLDERKLFVFVG